MTRFQDAAHFVRLAVLIANGLLFFHGEYGH